LVEQRRPQYPEEASRKGLLYDNRSLEVWQRQPRFIHNQAHGANFAAASATASDRVELDKLRNDINDKTSNKFSALEFKNLREQLRDDRLEQNRPEDFTGKYADCFFFSAPHAIALERDGDKAHKREFNTPEIVKSFAKTLKGGFVTWSKQELQRINKIGFQNNLSPRQRMDPSNRDPNYQRNSEMKGSPWLKALEVARSKCGTGTRLEDTGLHVDVHGMSDEHGADLIIGTKAMLRPDRKYKATQDIKQREKNLEMNLYRFLEPVLKGVRGTRKNGKPIRAFQKKILFFNQKVKRGTAKKLVPGFSGGVAGGDHNTLTMVSTNKSLFTGRRSRFGMAIQMEMSTNLRSQLANDAELAKRFAIAIREAYRSTAACDKTTKLCNLIPGATKSTGTSIWGPSDSRAVYNKLIAAGITSAQLFVDMSRSQVNDKIRNSCTGDKCNIIGADPFAALKRYIRTKLGTSRKLRGSNAAQPE